MAPNSLPPASTIREQRVTGYPWCSRERLATALEEHTVSELANEWGVCTDTIYRWRDRHGIGEGQ